MESHINEPLFGSRCGCHGKRSLIVRSREGGFVTQNCVESGQPRALQMHDLPQIDCANCGISMERFLNADKNYAYRCSRCNKSIELASIVPHWSERFEYFGYALDSDFVPAPGRPALNLQEIHRRLQ